MRRCTLFWRSDTPHPILLAMRFPVILLFSGMLVVPTLLAENATISGYVSRVASGSDFDVNGIRIRCGNQTYSEVVKARGALGTAACPQSTLYVGQKATVMGTFDKHDRALVVRKIDLTREPGSSGKVSGSAVISAISHSHSGSPAAGNLLVRADGYWILIPEKAFIIWDPPLHSVNDVKAGDWIYYLGRQQADGTVVAEKVTLTPMVVRKSEEKFREKSEFDPSKVPASARQNVLREAFFGVDYKKIPPASDAALQARIDEIGNKLVPAFEKNLPDADPAKVDFHFQLTADPRWREVAALPSGIILVPRKAVERMQNDSQLAALLAAGIASALERGPYRMRVAIRTTAIAAYVYDPIYGPGVTAGARAIARHKQQEQSERVALGLMHDAGYDVDQAPVAWWLLASTTRKPISEIPLPRRSGYLYKILGECWNNPAAVADRD